MSGKAFGWESKGGGGSVATGVLQLQNGVALDVTLRPITDQANTPSPLYLSTRQIGIYTYRTSIGGNDAILDVTGMFTSRSTANDTLRWGYFRPSLIGTASGQTLIGLDIAPTFTPNATSNTAFRPLAINYVIDNSTVQSGTATGIFLNVTETNLNGMASNFLDFKRNGTSRFTISSFGALITQSYAIFNNSTVVGNGAMIYEGSTANGYLGYVSANVWSLTNVTRLNLFGDTSSFPALVRDGANISIKKADGGSYTGLTAGTLVSLGGIQAYSTIEGYSTGQSAGFSGSVRVGSGGNNAASAILECVSTTKGFLAPRMTTTEVNAISTPADGLIVYNTTLSHLCVYLAGTWSKLSHSPM